MSTRHWKEIDAELEALVQIDTLHADIRLKEIFVEVGELPIAHRLEVWGRCRERADAMLDALCPEPWRKQAVREAVARALHDDVKVG